MAIRVKPTPQLDVVGSLDIEPINQTGLIREIKQNNKFLINTISCERGDDSIDALACHNDQEYKQMLKLQQDLLAERHFQHQVDTNRIKEVSKLFSSLRSHFVETNKFLKTCDGKRKQAKKTLTHEKQNHKQLRKTIEQYRNRIRELTDFRNVLSKTVKDMEPYETVINAVITTTGIFSSEKDCMDRCDALMEAQTEITTMKKEKLNEIEKIREQMTEAAKEGALTVLRYFNEISKLERDFDNARIECLKWERVLADVKDCIIKNETMKVRLMVGIQIIYRSLCQRRGIDPVLKKSEVEKQMDFIKDEIQIYQQVVRECKETAGDTSPRRLQVFDT